MNDPIGDMLTRIRNAQMRGKSTVSTPASKLRAWVLDVLADEGYIRGYEKTTSTDGHGAIEISLKYFDGVPVIECGCVAAIILTSTRSASARASKCLSES